MIPPTVPTEPRGAMIAGTDQPTGDAAANPPMDKLIHSRALTGVRARAAPKCPDHTLSP